MATGARNDVQPSPHWLSAGLLVLLCLVVYWPTLQGGFIWDDNVYLFENPLVRGEGGLGRIWAGNDAVEYYPLFTTSLWLEWRLFGMNATGYHMVGIVLHALSTLLVWRLLLRLKIPGAWLAAALFAVHPVNVESVAWISERKNTLSLVLSLTCVWAWLRFEVGRSRRLSYAVALLSFLAAVLTKTTVAVLPLVLLGCAWWQRGRVTRQDLVRAAPFLAIALVFGLVIVSQLTTRPPLTAMDRNLNFLDTVAEAGLAFWFYVGKVLWPAGLNLVYPHWGLGDPWIVAGPAWFALVVVFVVLWRFRRRWGRGGLFGLGFFLLGIVPALGFFFHPYLVQSPVADRWQYLPIIGLLALVGAAPFCAGTCNHRRLHRVARSTAVAAVGILAVMTWSRAGLFADAESLNQATLERNPDAVMVRNNLGLQLLQKGRTQEAKRQFEIVLSAHPGLAMTHSNLGAILAQEGETDEAIRHLREAVRLDPQMFIAHFNLGLLLAEQGRHADAVRPLQTALRIQPGLTRAGFALGTSLAELGRCNEAERILIRALRQSPGHHAGVLGMATVSLGRSRYEEAEDRVLRVLAVAPDLPAAKLLLERIEAERIRGSMVER